jgi:hypothetical protein
VDDLPCRERERVRPVEVDGHGLDEGVAGHVRHPVHGVDEAAVEVGVDVGVRLALEGIAVDLHGEREHAGEPAPACCIPLFPRRAGDAVPQIRRYTTRE